MSDRKTHKLVKYGTGAQVWGKCSCVMWAWLGAYFGDKRRMTELRARHAEHSATVVSS